MSPQAVLTLEFAARQQRARTGQRLPPWRSPPEDREFFDSSILDTFSFSSSLWWTFSGHLAAATVSIRRRTFSLGGRTGQDWREERRRGTLRTRLASLRLHSLKRALALGQEARPLMK